MDFKSIAIAMLVLSPFAHAELDWKTVRPVPYHCSNGKTYTVILQVDAKNARIKQKANALAMCGEDTASWHSQAVDRHKLNACNKDNSPATDWYPGTDKKNNCYKEFLSKNGLKRPLRPGDTQPVFAEIVHGDPLYAIFKHNEKQIRPVDARGSACYNAAQEKGIDCFHENDRASAIVNYRSFNFAQYRCTIAKLNSKGPLMPVSADRTNCLKNYLSTRDATGASDEVIADR
jgi:hypothetical protein